MSAILRPAHEGQKARLLEENKRQAEAEALAGKPKKKASAKKAPRKPPTPDSQGTLF